MLSCVPCFLFFSFLVFVPFVCVTCSRSRQETAKALDGPRTSQPVETFMSVVWVMVVETTTIYDTLHGVGGKSGRRVAVFHPLTAHSMGVMDVERVNRYIGSVYRHK